METLIEIAITLLLVISLINSSMWIGRKYGNLANAVTRWMNGKPATYKNLKTDKEYTEQEKLMLDVISITTAYSFDQCAIVYDMVASFDRTIEILEYAMERAISTEEAVAIKHLN